MAVSTRKLAPLDHSRTLYAGAAGLQKEAGAPTQFRIEELQMAVRQMAPLNNPSRKLEEQILKQSDAFVESGTEGRLNTVESELRALKDSLNESARRYNTLRTQAKQKQKRLQTLVDRLEQLRYETQGIRELEKHETPEAKRLQHLKQEIEVVDKHVSQKLRYKHQLHHVLERSRDSYTRYDANIKAMADALRVAAREMERVEALMRQLDNARDKAVKDMLRVKGQVAADDDVRRAQLEQRKQEAFTAQRMDAWRKQREHMRLELAAELRGDLSKEEEEKLKRRFESEERATRQLDVKQKEKATEAERHERIHHKIRKATGVASLSDMHKKYEGQDRARHELEDSKAAVELHLAQARARKRALEREFAELKASGVGGTELSRETKEKLEGKIARSRASLKVNQASCERLDAVLVAVRQGALGLNQRLQMFPSLLTAREEASVELTGVPALDLLRHAEASLGKMRRKLDAAQHDRRRRSELARARGGQGPSATDRDDPHERPESPLSVLTSRSGGVPPLATPVVPGSVKPVTANIRVFTRRAVVEAERARAKDRGTERASQRSVKPGAAGEEADSGEDSDGRRRIKQAAQRAQAAEAEREQKAKRRAKQAEKEALSGAPARQSAKAFMAHQKDYMEKLAGTSRSEVPPGPLSPAKAPPVASDDEDTGAFFITQAS